MTKQEKKTKISMKSVPNKVSQARSTESADVTLSGMPNDDASKIPI